MKIIYEFNDDNENDMYVIQRYQQTNDIHRAVDALSDWLRTNTKYWTETSGLDQGTMEKVREKFHEIMNVNNVNLDI